MATIGTILANRRMIRSSSLDCLYRLSLMWWKNNGDVKLGKMVMVLFRCFEIGEISEKNVKFEICY